MDSTRSFFSLYAYRVYLAGLFLIPVALVASAVVPLTALKVFIATVALVVSLVLAVVAALRRGGMTIPVNGVMLASWLLPLSYVIGLLATPSLMLSIVGNQLDVDTVFFMVLLALATTLPLYLFETRTDFVRAFFVLLASAWIVALFQIIRLIGGSELLSFGIFTSPLFTLVGKWNDLAIFFGFVSVLSLITLESMPLQTLYRSILGVTLAIALFFMALVNFMPVWVVLGVISLGIILYRALLSGGGQARFSVASIVVFVAAVVMVLFTSTLGAYLGNSFGTNQIEARPSWQSTISIAQHTIEKSPLLGSGPNTFLLQWDKYRPTDLNQSVFWNADFTSGVGFMPTSVVSVGLLGLVAWLVFFGMFLLSGVRALLQQPPADSYAYHLTLASFTGALYLLIMSVLYLPSPVLLIIAFAVVGMFASLQHHERHGRNIGLVFSERPRIGFVAVLALVILLVASVVSLYGVGTVFTADVYYERAAAAAQRDNNIDAAQAYIKKATDLVAQDRLYRLATLINLARLGTIVNATPTPGDTDKLQADFQSALGGAVENGLAAVRLNQQDFRNWQTVGSAYHSVVSLKINGAYESASAAYAKAAALNPITPAVPLARAQLEAAKGDLKAARPYVETAIKIKEDYIPALLLLAQIELTDGNLGEAIKRAEAASVFEPSNPVTKFQVGVLKFENKDFVGADVAFTAAVALTPNYANARYYLGRTRLVEGKRDEALVQFEEVRKLNPDNTDVPQVIATIKAGGDPFAPAPEKTGTKK